MTSLLHWLRAVRIFAGRMPLCPSEVPAWTDRDQGALGNFFRNQSAGQKLVLLMRYQEQTVNASAVCRPSGCAYNAGYAAGFRSACAMLESLSANVTPHPDDSSKNHVGADDLAERLAP